MPGFIDTHIHAPQVPNIGLGLDKPLMEWLNAYTFPTETEFKDKAFAKNVYEKVVVSIYIAIFLYILFYIMLIYVCQISAQNIELWNNYRLLFCNYS